MGRQGGLARAEKLTPERRQEIARLAANKRWSQPRVNKPRVRFNKKWKHTYPTQYPPGSHWAITAAWEILDIVKPGIIPNEIRALLAGLIAGRLIRELKETETSPNK